MLTHAQKEMKHKLFKKEEFLCKILGMEKLRPSIGRRIMVSLIAFFVGAVIIFLICFNLFTTFPWQVICYIIAFGYLLLAIISTVMYFKFSYYVIEKEYFVERKLSKELYYYYNDIIYIDQKRKSQKSTIGFYTNKGHVRYLTPDKEDVLFKTLLEKCHHLLSEEEFKNKYPNINL